MATIPSPVVLDLSHHNDVVSWSSLKEAGIKGIILKATQGVKYVDPTYAKRRTDARAAGLLTGAYHFCTNADPRAQIDWFLAHAQVDADLLLALDWENNPDGPDMDVEQARLAVEYLMLKTARPKNHIVVYGGNVLKERVTAPDDVNFFGDCKLWLCQYGPHATLPPAWQNYWLWQFSEKFAGLHGVTGQVDANVFGGADLALEWAPGNGSAPAPTSRSDTEVADEAVMAVASAAPAKPAYDWSQWSFAKVNDLADQGSRLAEKIRDFKTMIWKGGSAAGGTALVASQTVDFGQGTGAAVNHFASGHPFLLCGVVSAVMLVIGYVGIKLVEQGLLSAHADGRYTPRGAK